jgi:hypothetical protein
VMPELLAARLQMRLPLGIKYAIEASDIPALVRGAGSVKALVKRLRRRYPDHDTRAESGKYFGIAVRDAIESDLCCYWMELVDRGLKLRGEVSGLACQPVQF